MANADKLSLCTILQQKFNPHETARFLKLTGAKVSKILKKLRVWWKVTALQ